MGREHKYTEQEIAYVLGLKESSEIISWDEVTEKFNKKFKTDLTSGAIVGIHRRYKNLFEKEDYQVKVLKDIHRTRKNNSYTARDYKEVLDLWNRRDDILESVKMASADILKVLKKKPIKIEPLPKTSKKKIGMTKELLISDVHFGKKVEFSDPITGEKTLRFNLEILKKRIQEVTEVTIKEIARDQVHYNVEKLIVAMLGDMIESATMHALESAKGCEFGNSRQIYEAIRCLFTLLLLPLAKTGIEIQVIGVEGNHDRTESHVTYNNPGEEHVTWIIYNSLRDLCREAGLDNIKFIIPAGSWAVVDIYGKNVLYEHGYHAKGPDRKSLETHMATRSNQMRKPIEWMRCGHFHCKTEYGLHREIINGSFPGDDSYSLIKGYLAEACQVLCSYVNTKSRPSPFYKSLSIQLDHII